MHLNIFNTGMPAYLPAFIIFNNGPQQLDFCSVHSKDDHVSVNDVVINEAGCTIFLFKI